MIAVLKDKFLTFLGVALLSLAPLLVGPVPKAAAAACTVPTTDYGTVTSTINITETGSYRVWSRIQTGTASTDNSYLLEIDGNTCYTVGDNNAIPAGSWKWIDYQNGTTTNKINHNFTTTGSHTVKMIGNSDGVLLDRVIFTKDTTAGSSCDLTNSTDTGDNCVNPPNVAPAVSVAASPTSGSAPLSTTLTATPTDSDGTIAKVEFFQGTTKLGERTSAPWTQSVTGLAAGSHSFTAKATDNSGAVTTSSAVTVTVGAAQKPGDANGDGTVGSADLAIIAFNWSKTGMTFSKGDFNGDGTVGSADLAIIAFNWGQ